MSTSKGGSPRKSQERKDFEAHASAIGGLVASRIRTMKTTDLGMKLASSVSIFVATEAGRIENEYEQERLKRRKGSSLSETDSSASRVKEWLDDTEKIRLQRK